jgi:hypothetical protein
LIDYYRSGSRLVVVDGVGVPAEVFGRLSRAVEGALGG